MSRAPRAALAVCLACLSICCGRAEGPEPGAPFAADAHQPRREDGVPVLGTVHSARFAGGEAHLGDAVTLGLSAFGRAGAMHDVDAAEAQIVGPEVRIARAPGVTEWWRSLPAGLEQGVTLEVRPAGEGALTLVMGVDDGTRIEVSGDDFARLLDDRTGAHLADYQHVVAADADGARVPARMAALDAHHLALTVEDHHARYPLVVDPLVTLSQASLSASGADFGHAVAIAADGARVIVGAPEGGGVATIHERSGTTWALEQTLPGTGHTDEHFGTAVAMSADGARVLVGSSYYGAEFPHVGEARVYRFAAPSWVEEDLLTGSAGGGRNLFGTSVALSGDGRRAVIGAPGLSGNGTVYVFLRVAVPADDWQEEARIDGAAGASVGDSVAISSDGQRIVIGAGTGARVLVRTGTTWTDEAALAGGTGVAISADGLRVLVTDGDTGRVHVRTGATWSEEGTLAPSAPAAGFGAGRWISSDGLRALVGAPYGGAFGSVHVFVRRGSVWSADGLLGFTGVPAGAALGTSVAASEGTVRAVVGLPSAPGARVVTLVADDGDPCSDDLHCASGACVDGVCCTTGCGGGDDGDCQACAMALTGVADGTCAPLSAAAASATVCRAATGLCDVPETCVPASTACPADVLAPSGQVCGGEAPGSCGSESACTGASPSCPSATPLPMGTVCRSPAGPCDRAELCSGTSVACPSDEPEPAGASCRAAAGVCDLAELCDGASTACPPDVLLPAGLSCGGTEGTCASSGNVCTGTGPACSDAMGVRAAGEECAPASAGGCDLPDVCDGVTSICAPRFQPVETACGPAPAGPCDAPDHCAGTADLCVAAFLSSVECRASAGACDPAERCTGADALCPPDSFSPAGTVCRGSADPSCDPLESCDGAAASCPVDVVACVDASPDGGVSVPPPAAACTCRASRSSVSWWPASLLLLFALRRRL